MHLRRALLLFAIVLGLAALAASLSRSPSESGREEPPALTDPPSASSNVSADLRLRSGRGGRRALLRAGQARTLLVAVPTPGQVELPELGLSAPAEPLTPARFEILVEDRGSYRVDFLPAGGSEARSLGALVVR